MKTEREWQETGRQPMSRQQQKLLNAACGCLAPQIEWHGYMLSKDDWRAFLAANVLRQPVVPAFDKGEGPQGFIVLGASSKLLSKEQATECITMAFMIGDFPEDQGLKSAPVRWSEVICKARWITEDEPYEVRQVYQAPNKDGSPENRCRERGAMHGVSRKG